MKGVAIVILNWNRRNDLLALLGSLFAAHYGGHDIIVVDNASTDGSVEAVRSSYPSVQLVRNAENLGGAGGFNTGLRHALGKGYEYVWLLDNDSLVCAGALEPLLAAAQSQPALGLVGSRLLHSDNPGLINETGALINPRTAAFFAINSNEPDRPLPELLDVDYVALCSVLVRLAAARSAGLLDEAYFFKWDDMEWGLRFKRAGFRIAVATGSRVLHPAFTEVPQSSRFHYYYSRNHFYFVARNFRGWQRLFLIALISAKNALRGRRERWVGATQVSRIREAAERDFWRLAMGASPATPAGADSRDGTLPLEAALADCRSVAYSTAAPRAQVQAGVAGLQRAGKQVVLYGNGPRRENFRWFDGPVVWRQPGAAGYLQWLAGMRRHRCEVTVVQGDEFARLPTQLGRYVIRIDAAGRVLSKTPARPLASVAEQGLLVIAQLGSFAAGFTRGLWRALTRPTLHAIDQALRARATRDNGSPIATNG